MSGDCGKRAVIAALRWCGIEEFEIEHLGLSFGMTDDLKALAKHFDLIWFEDGKISTGNNPVLVSYYDDTDMTDGEAHCVFISDAAPMAKYRVHSMIVGWERLRERRAKRQMAYPNETR